LKNPDIRKALSMAIDRKKLVQESYKGQFEPAMTILPPGMPGYRRQNETVVENIAGARELAKAVLGDVTTSLPPIEIVSVSQSSFAKAELRFISDSWAKLGFSVEIKFVSDWKEFTEYRNSESVQIYRASWTADMPDPDSFLNPLFASDSPVNYMRYSSKEVDRLLKNAVGITDPVKRAETYRQIEAIIIESSPVIPLVYISVDRVYQPYVQGIEISALGSHTMPLNRVWLKDIPVR
jgi:ABC-type transport system substrate-binding protein